jgi:hypothetical protein
MEQSGRDSEGSQEQSPELKKDLASVRPGQPLDAQAGLLREAAPFRTRLARILRVHNDERAYRIGGKGERQVARKLGELGPKWHILHSIVLSDTGTDLDHLVIGPGGVFCINTKNHPGKRVWVGGNTLMVSGQRQGYVGASRSEAKKVSRMLTTACGHHVQVDPIVVIANGELIVKEQPNGVHVASRRRIRSWILEQPESLSDDAASAIFVAASRLTTWSWRKDVRGRNNVAEHSYFEKHERQEQTN